MFNFSLLDHICGSKVCDSIEAVWVRVSARICKINGKSTSKSKQLKVQVSLTRNSTQNLGYDVKCGECWTTGSRFCERGTKGQLPAWPRAALLPGSQSVSHTHAHRLRAHWSLLLLDTNEAVCSLGAVALIFRRPLISPKCKSCLLPGISRATNLEQLMLDKLHMQPPLQTRSNWKACVA